MDEKKTHLIGEDVKTLPLKELLKRIGPGLIATGIVIGPGAVTTAAMLGANYGYALIWLVFPIIFMGITFVMTTNWLAITTGMPTIHAIRKYYGKAGAGVVGIALFLACLFFTMGNISGSGAGMNLIFGINWKIGSLLLIAVVVYTYFAKNVYSKVEKLITACIIIMILAFYITLFGAGHGSADNGVVGFEGGKFAKGLFGCSFPEGSLGTALAFISTNAAITTGIYNTYLGKEKKWKRDDLFNGVMVNGDFVGDTLFYGRGAGRAATASAVVSDIADAALKQLRVFKHRGSRFSVTGQRSCIAHFTLYILPAVAVSGQHIPCPAGSLCKHFHPPVPCIRIMH